ncbi:hypothetical protein [Actinopolymorpha alba]|uniref:hypothetical protein n=1 Tax=Actinopolymorpha alba TaxID=533267 RepID=UPI0003657AC5|nr:hypothetical protein [Actinopolymorpha alba]
MAELNDGEAFAWCEARLLRGEAVEEWSDPDRAEAKQHESGDRRGRSADSESDSKSHRGDDHRDAEEPEQPDPSCHPVDD